MSWTTVANSFSNNGNTVTVDTSTSNDGTGQQLQNTVDNTGSYVEEDDDEDYETDDDSYEDIDMAAWGDNKKEEVGWHTLVDPSFKVKAGGIGSGDLHRRGGNFKPVSEQFILSQRLKKGIPATSSGTKKKKKKKSKSSTVAAPAAKPVLIAGNRNRPYVPVKLTSVTQRAPIKDPNATAWGKLPLSSTPFWEEKGTKKEEEQVKLQSQIHSQFQPKSQMQMQPQTQYPPQQPQFETQQPSSQPKQQPQFQQQPQKTPLPSIVNSAWNPEVPSFIPSTSTSTSSSSVKTQSYNTEAPAFVPLYQQPVKKTVLMSAPPPTPTPSDTTTNAKSRKHIDTSLLRRYLTAKSFHPSTKSKLESQTGPESTRGLEEPVPILRFNLDLAPGVTAVIQAYYDSEPADLVEQFAQKHQLSMTNTAKENISKTIKLLMDKKKEVLDCHSGSSI
jgi:hypothetical protein